MVPHNVTKEVCNLNYDNIVLHNKHKFNKRKKISIVVYDDRNVGSIYSTL